MVMHRALFTWFLLLIFFVFLCVRLEARIHWNWFLIFIPMWVFDVIVFVDALVNIVIHCKHKVLKNVLMNKNNYILIVVLLKIATQILICLKLEYRALNLEIYHVFIPFWILLPLVIIDVSISLFKSAELCL
ncbi:PREDICTED: transmembrane protein 60-like [Nicrophorus vespilloides]|uniref:Transmembrane protein 60-like n=1 Tax=Nicrophorus vespilloides TaxID=110193 RepID=A0ABM1MFW0_NICVS|nr:PREDICTED: transmembrane protein 60-like [Nicrophorus vespilloides]